MSAKVSYFGYLWKTSKWMFGNTFFGIFPLIYLYAVHLMSEGKVCGDSVDNLICEGSIIFVCTAIVGAVYTDYYLSDAVLNGWSRFATFFFPLIIFFIASINYLLIHMHIIDKNRFALTSSTTLACIILSIIYVFFVKTNLYIREDNRHEQNV